MRLELSEYLSQDTMKNMNKQTLAQAQALLIKQTQHAMMNHQDSSMWGICDGVLENATAHTALYAIHDGDEAAAQVVGWYIAQLELML